ncbi:hypothetical protein PMAYCL1PPCAC_02181 [Pristionchus mayeri]|uniref:SET domain-containing protein n=1 Tax=Pristionchus mayeri TaxID=1317129 RepID=A0AAN5C861_9BILA|nr:hypothetical protein PMAYCL1PPCAC_02181 [Pristionchus mayeri]
MYKPFPKPKEPQPRVEHEEKPLPVTAIVDGNVEVNEASSTRKTKRRESKSKAAKPRRIPSKKTSRTKLRVETKKETSARGKQNINEVEESEESEDAVNVLTYTVPLRQPHQLKCCVFCDEKSKNGEYITCAFRGCSQKMHGDCAENFICSEYTPRQAQLLFCADGPICPAHFCFHCYEERKKNASRFGELIDCEKCVRTFHLTCLPAGAKISSTPGKRKTFVCHHHIEKEPPIKDHMRLKVCTECDELCTARSASSKRNGNTRMECKRCTNVFHLKCSFQEVKGLKPGEYDNDLCSYCLQGSIIVSNQRVLAFCPFSYLGLPTGNYPGEAVALSDIPPGVANLLGGNLGKVGYIPIKWEWKDCDKPFFNLIPASRVQRMSLSSEMNLSPNIPFLEEVMSAKKKFAAPTCPLDNEAMSKTISIVTENVYMKGLGRIQETEEIEEFECGCKPDEEGIKCNTDQCMNRVVKYECPKTCDEAEGVFCANRAMQRNETSAKHELKLAGNGKGFGIFATGTIKPLEYIFEYAGEVIDKEELEKRQERIRALRANDEWTYLMGLAKGCSVDARFKGGLARYVNHSCDPNSKVETINVPTRYPNSTKITYEPKLKVQAVKEITAGEEITFRYELKKTVGLALDTCRCGAKKCAGKIGKKREKDTNENERFDGDVEDEEEEDEQEDEKENKKKTKKNVSGTRKKNRIKRRPSFSAPPSSAKRRK